MSGLITKCDMNHRANALQELEGGEEVLPLTDTTQAASNDANIVEGAAVSKKAKTPKEPRAPREPRQRGPPEDGVPSKNKVMVANLPYDLSEEKVCSSYVRF